MNFKACGAQPEKSSQPQNQSLNLALLSLVRRPGKKRVGETAKPSPISGRGFFYRAGRTAGQARHVRRREASHLPSYRARSSFSLCHAPTVCPLRSQPQLMPPLRPLPSQSLRPAWSAGQLCRGPSAARLPRTHSLRAADARYFASTPDDVANDDTNAQGGKDASEETKNEPPPAGQVAKTEYPPATKHVGHVRVGKTLDPLIRAVYEVTRPNGRRFLASVDKKNGKKISLATQQAQQGTLIRPVGSPEGMKQRNGPPKSPRKSHPRSPRKSPHESPREMDRLQRLARIGSSLNISIERPDGTRIGAITENTLRDESTWKRLKQDLTEVVEGDSASATWRKVSNEPDYSRERTPGNRKRWDNEAQEPKSRTETPEPKWREPRPDPVSVRDRLRAAIGNISSSLSAELEDHTEPSRYRQDVPRTRRSIHDQRLDELEALLVQASRRLRELKGHDMQERPDLDWEFAFDEWSDVSSKRRNNLRRGEWREGITPVRGGKSKAQATVELDNRDDREFMNLDSAPPMRYLSRDPSRPLPHTTGRAIPPDLFGPRANMSPNRETSSLKSRQSLDVDEETSESAVEPRERSRKSEEPNSTESPDLFEKFLAERPKPPPSLLNELFPEFTDENQETSRKTQEEREVPKLSLDFHQQKPERRPAFLERKEFINRKMQAKYLNELVVIKLSGLSKHLNEEDIKRLVPSSSKHIEGWSDLDFIKGKQNLQCTNSLRLVAHIYYSAFPVRDEQTLERLDQYYVLFRNVRAARDFQENVRKLHLLVKSHAPTSLSSTLPTPPGFTDDKGIDLHAAIQSYTIGPPISDRIHCNVVPTPYTKNLRQVFMAGGYEPIVNHSNPVDPAGASQEPAVAKVLLHFDGAQPTLGEIRTTIARDGKDRWLPWAIVGGTNSRDGIFRITNHFSRNEAVGSDVAALMVRKVAPRYMITFETKAEAQRFVRRWHRRPFQWSVNGVYENGEGPPQARVELLW